MNELQLLSRSAPMITGAVPKQKRHRRGLPRRIKSFASICSSRAFSRSALKNFREVSSVELLQHCLSVRDERPWFEFVRRFQPLIAAVLTKTLRRSIHPGPSLVDDLVQETYLKLCANDFKALRNFDCRHEHALEGFLKVVASNVAQDYLRSFLSQKRGSGKAEDNLEKTMLKADCMASSITNLERTVIVRQIEQCLEKQRLEPNFKRNCRIFWLYYRYGLTAEAIARLPGTGLSTKGVESALLRLTELLRININGTVAS